MNLPPCFGFLAFPFVSSQTPSAFYPANTQQMITVSSILYMCNTLALACAPDAEKDRVILGSISRPRDWETTGLEGLSKAHWQEWSQAMRSLDKTLRTNTSKSTSNFSDDCVGKGAKLRRVMRGSMGYEEFNLSKTFEIFDSFELCLRLYNIQSSANETGLYLYDVVTAMMGV